MNYSQQELWDSYCIDNLYGDPRQDREPEEEILITLWDEQASASGGDIPKERRN